MTCFFFVMTGNVALIALKIICFSNLTRFGRLIWLAWEFKNISLSVWILSYTYTACTYFAVHRIKKSTLSQRGNYCDFESV